MSLMVIRKKKTPESNKNLCVFVADVMIHFVFSTYS